MFGFLAKEMGIDLGTANTLIYIKDKGMVLNEASCIAYDKRNAEVIATGAKAKAMYGKAPKDIVVVKPLQDGVISDFDMAAEMLQRFIRTAMGEKKPSGMRIVIGVPSSITEVKKLAVEKVDDRAANGAAAARAIDARAARRHHPALHRGDARHRSIFLLSARGMQTHST